MQDMGQCMVSDDSVLLLSWRLFFCSIFSAVPSRLSGLGRPHVLVRNDGRDLARRRGLGLRRGVSRHTVDLHVSETIQVAATGTTYSVEAIEVLVAGNLEDGRGTLSGDAVISLHSCLRTPLLT